MSTPRVSFAVTTHNEGEYIQTLLNQLVPYCIDAECEVVIIDDNSTDPVTVSILEANAAAGPEVRVFKRPFSGNFADHKNQFHELCRGEYIFQIDADETVNISFLDSLEYLLNLNPTVELFLVPRINTVLGLTDEDVSNWGWSVNSLGWINFPDYQTRLYKNIPEVRWINKVHERVQAQNYVLLPAVEEWSLYHVKTIDRQRDQNNFYMTLTE